LFKIIKAPITPGIHPHRVRMKTISTEPQPLSITARGGKIMERITLINDISVSFLEICRKVIEKIRNWQ
jgi:hypothetical protein